MNLGVPTFFFCSKIRQRAPIPSGFWSHVLRALSKTLWMGDRPITGHPPTQNNIKQKQQTYKWKLRRVRFEHMSQKTVQAVQCTTTSNTPLSRILWAYLCLHLRATCPGHCNVLRFITLIILGDSYLNNITWPIQVTTWIILHDLYKSVP
jgi:hypothetical protein